MKYLYALFLVFSSFLAESQILETFAGSGIPGYLDGDSEQARFSNLEQIAVDQEGNVYVCDQNNHVIRKIDLNGEVSTFAGSGVQGDQLGSKEKAQFFKPTGIAFDIEGNLYVVDKDNNKIKVIRTNGMVEWVAGSGSQGFADGPVESAMFDFPTYICVDDSNNLYLAGNNDNRIRKINLTTQLVSTFAGNDNQVLQDGVGTEASFALPQGIAIDKNNNIYVGDRLNNAIRKITPDGNVTTLAGTGILGFEDGPGEQAKFNGPKGVGVDSIGNVYVADRLNFVVRKIDTFGIVSTVAGTPGSSGYFDGEYSEGNLIGRAVSVACHDGQSILIADWENDVIRKLILSPISSTHNPVLQKNNTIIVSPNPSSDFIRIEGELGEQFQIALLNAQGQLLRIKKNENIMNAQDFPPGTYFLLISNNTYLNLEKIIIE